MKQKFALTLAIVSLLAICAATAAEATVKITFVNNTDSKVHVATLTNREGLASKGWYSVDPGKKITITFKRKASQRCKYLGFYAYGGKLVWSGKWQKWRIHPKKKFQYVSQGRDKDSYPDSGWKEVGFRQLTDWKRSGEDAWTTVNFKMR
jgi:hypothetical protein